MGELSEDRLLKSKIGQMKKGGLTGSPNKHFLPPTFKFLRYLSENSGERDKEDEKKIHVFFLKRMKLSALRKWKILLLTVSHAAADSCFPQHLPDRGR